MPVACTLTGTDNTGRVMAIIALGILKRPTNVLSHWKMSIWGNTTSRKFSNHEIYAVMHCDLMYVASTHAELRETFDDKVSTTGTSAGKCRDHRWLPQYKLMAVFSCDSEQF